MKEQKGKNEIPLQMKQRLRRELGQRMETLPQAYMEHADAAIAKTLLASAEYRKADTLFCYVSVGREVDTRAILEHAWAQGKRVCVPRCLGGGVMEARQVFAFDDLRPAAFGLWEPGEEAPLVQPEELELVVAPCVSCDSDCRRLGHGCGYYERYLRRVHCPVVALCRAQLLADALPEEPYDRRADKVLTEEQTYENV